MHQHSNSLGPSILTWILSIKRFLLVLAFCILGLCSKVEGQILIYTLDFETSPKTPDFQFYDGGWIVVDLNALKTSFVFTTLPATSGEEQHGFFIESANCGEFFFSSIGESFFGNIRATSDDESAEASYLLSGSIDSEALTVDPNSSLEVSIAVPGTLTGYLLASETGSYAEATSNSKETMNVVGISEIEATLDQSSSDYFNKRLTTAQEVIEYIATDLQKAGLVRDQ